MATEKELAIRKAVEELERLTADPALQRILDAEELARLDEEVLRKQNIKEVLELGIQKGMKKWIREGRKKGIEEGIEKGIKKGIKEGREEGKKEEKREVAKKLLAMNFDIEKISEITGLSLLEIEKIK